MTPSKDRAHNLLDHFRLPDHYPAKLVDHHVAGLAELSQVFADAIL